MSDSAIVVDDEQELPIATPEPPPMDLEVAKPSKITAKQAEAAAKAMGMSVTKVKRLAASKDLGAYISQLGVVKIGRTMLAFTAEQLQDTIEQCDKFLADDNSDPELRAQVIQVKKELLGQYITVANSMIKSASVDASDGADAAIPSMPFMPGQIVIPASNAQVNIGVGPNKP